MARRRVQIGSALVTDRTKRQQERPEKSDLSRRALMKRLVGPFALAVPFSISAFRRPAANNATGTKSPPAEGTPSAFMEQARRMRSLALEMGDQGYGAVIVKDGAHRRTRGRAVLSLIVTLRHMRKWRPSGTRPATWEPATFAAASCMARRGPARCARRRPIGPTSRACASDRPSPTAENHDCAGVEASVHRGRGAAKRLIFENFSFLFYKKEVS